MGACHRKRQTTRITLISSARQNANVAPRDTYRVRADATVPPVPFRSQPPRSATQVSIPVCAAYFDEYVWPTAIVWPFVALRTK